jgi:hypothetical protein
MVPAMVGARFAYLAALLAVVLWLLAGCAGGGVPSEERAAWRDKAESACMASGRVRASPYIQSAGNVDGPSACGILAPLKVSGVGLVRITPAATIDCPLTASLERWLNGPVQKAAYRQFGKPVVEIKQIASYGCRGRNGRHRGPLSEHAYGNALDVAAFRLSDGTEITVIKGWWRGTARERAFLTEAFAGACDEFYTVLGPGADRHHYNHFHVDLLVTNVSHGRHFCQPRPSRGFFAQADGQADPVSTASIKPIPFLGPSGD